MEPFLTVGLGILTGALLGLTGAGGGIIAAPLLMIFLHLPLTEAVPISLFALTLGCGTSVLLSLRQNLINYRAVLLLSVTGIVATPLGIYLSHHLPKAPLLLAFSALLIYRALRLWRMKEAHVNTALACPTDGNGRFLWNRPCARAMILAGALAGFFGGLLGVGGGFVIVPALRKHTPMAMHAIIATSLATLTIVSFSGLLQWQSHNAIQWQIGLPFIAGTIVGIAGGRIAAPHIAELTLRRVFAALCVLVAIGLQRQSLLSGTG